MSKIVKKKSQPRKKNSDVVCKKKYSASLEKFRQVINQHYFYLQSLDPIRQLN